MSDNLVRRQRFARELRRKEVEEYMRRIRERLLNEAEEPQQQGPLSHYELEQMKSQLEEENFTTAAVERFLLQLKGYSVESLCSPEFFALFETSILYVLQRGNNGGPNALVHSLAKSLVIRAIECSPNEQGRLPLEFCFKEVLEILTNEHTEMGEVWKAVSLVRSEAILELSFSEFLFYFEHCSDLIQIETVFEVLANFTATIEGHEKTSLSITGCFHVITKLVTFFSDY